MLLGDIRGLFAAGLPVESDDSAAVDLHRRIIGRVADKGIGRHSTRNLRSRPRHSTEKYI
jgi:hypothetical protein